jgi:hypothetical protein
MDNALSRIVSDVHTCQERLGNTKPQPLNSEDHDYFLRMRI